MHLIHTCCMTEKRVKGYVHFAFANLDLLHSLHKHAIPPKCLRRQAPRAQLLFQQAWKVLVTVCIRIPLKSTAFLWKNIWTVFGIRR